MAIQNNDAVNTTAVPAPEKKHAPEKQETVKQPGTIKRFLREVTQELKKTNWPSRSDLMKAVIVVIITITAVAVYLYVSDVVAFKIAQLFHIAPQTTGLGQ